MLRFNVPVGSSRIAPIIIAVSMTLAMLGAFYLIWEIVAIQRELEEGEECESCDESEGECESECDECGYILDRLVSIFWPEANDKCSDCVRRQRNRKYKRR